LYEARCILCDSGVAQMNVTDGRPSRIVTHLRERD
jgi:hypothetical protein